MYVKRYLSPLIIYYYSWRMVLFSLFTGGMAIFLYSYLGWSWVGIPWLPVSLVGTATAFFVGFKNNQSYDRSWEHRDIASERQRNMLPGLQTACEVEIEIEKYLAGSELVRNIEIDLIDMLDDDELVPEKIQPHFGALF